MILSAKTISQMLPDASGEYKGIDPLVITPVIDIDKMARSGSASIDLRLGTWFTVMKQSKVAMLAVEDEVIDAARKAKVKINQIAALQEFLPISSHEERLVKTQYVPFGSRFILHPGNFVLGVTLEWIRLPKDIAGYVIGKSSWGRRGLIIETAAGIHPGFTGCLTLELSNCNEIPIVIKPGTQVCQLFLHRVETDKMDIESSCHAFKRKPKLGKISLDPVAKLLSMYKGL